MLRTPSATNHPLPRPQQQQHLRMTLETAISIAEPGAREGAQSMMAQVSVETHSSRMRLSGTVTYRDCLCTCTRWKPQYSVMAGVGAG
jgi:hypothetical protein